MKWEYRFVDVKAKISDKKTTEIVNEELSKLSDEGWELVKFYPDIINARFYFVFKRLKE